MKKRIMALVLALVMCVGLAMSSAFASPAEEAPADNASSPEDSASEAAAYSTNAVPKGVLLFVGPRWDNGVDYPVYSKADITKLSQTTSEFIVCAGNVLYNTYQFSNSSERQIITEQLINGLTTDLIAYPSRLDNVKSDYLYLLTGVRPIAEETGESHINDLMGRLDPSWQAYQKAASASQKAEPAFSHLQSLFGNLDPSWRQYQTQLTADSSQSTSWVERASKQSYKLDDLATDVVNQVNIIVSANPNATIWLPFPLIQFQSFAAQYEAPFKQYVNVLKSSLGTTTWSKNIRGFYWGTEAVGQYYTPFNYSSTAAQGFGNPMVQLMNKMDSFLSSNSKQFLWIPYLGGTETLQRNGYIANRTSVFDYALFQASYYTGDYTIENDETFSNMPHFSLIQKSVLENRLYNRNNVVIGGSKSGSTVIGYEMELDDKVINQNENDRYWFYTYYYSGLKSYPQAFYAGDRNSICGTTNGAQQCFKFVKLWLTQ